MDGGKGRRRRRTNGWRRFQKGKQGGGGGLERKRGVAEERRRCVRVRACMRALRPPPLFRVSVRVRVILDPARPGRACRCGSCDRRMVKRRTVKRQIRPKRGRAPSPPVDSKTMHASAPPRPHSRPLKRPRSGPEPGLGRGALGCPRLQALGRPKAERPCSDLGARSFEAERPCSGHAARSFGGPRVIASRTWRLCGARAPRVPRSRAVPAPRRQRVAGRFRAGGGFQRPVCAALLGRRRRQAAPFSPRSLNAPQAGCVLLMKRDGAPAGGDSPAKRRRPAQDR